MYKPISFFGIVIGLTMLNILTFYDLQLAYITLPFTSLLAVLGAWAYGNKMLKLDAVVATGEGDSK